MPAPAAPLYDPSAPCSGDLSRLLRLSSKCSTGSALGPGANGSMSAPTTGTWTYTLNATGGGSGGGGGFSYQSPDPDPDEWGR